MIFSNFNKFTRLYVWTIDGLLAIGNRSNPRVYLLPPGEIEVKGVEKGDGNKAKNEDGKFIHAGGWLVVHENNSVAVDLVDCWEKQLYEFDKVTTPQGTESDSHLGKVISQLQIRATKMVKRRR